MHITFFMQEEGAQLNWAFKNPFGREPWLLLSFGATSLLSSSGAKTKRFPRCQRKIGWHGEEGSKKRVYFDSFIYCFIIGGGFFFIQALLFHLFMISWHEKKTWNLLLYPVPRLEIRGSSSSIFSFTKICSDARCRSRFIFLQKQPASFYELHFVFFMT